MRRCGAGLEEQHFAAITDGARHSAGSVDAQRGDWQVQPELGSMDDELPSRLFQGWWDIEPDIGRVTNESKNRAGKLKALGNAQVPLQAAVAYTMLLELFA